ncbi:MAG: adenylate kinase [Roseburia sp.]
MSDENELLRLTKENDNFRKIIETQERTIKRLVDYFVLEQSLQKRKAAAFTVNNS